MFAEHADSRSSSFRWTSLADRVVGFFSGSARSRSELLPRTRTPSRPRSAVSPVSQSISVQPKRRLTPHRRGISENELREQAWLDDRLMAFYERRHHGLWPTVRRVFGGSHHR